MDEVKSNLNKLVSKTPINDKLLSRPPFRYLYDLITEINEKSKCFQLQVIDADNVTKEEKIEFLKSIIDQVGSTANAKPSKIVAGMEVEQTWELLNLITAKATIKSKEMAKSTETKKSKPDDKISAEKSMQPEDRKPTEKSEIPKKSGEKPEITKKASDKRGLVKPEALKKIEKDYKPSSRESLSKEKLIKKSTSRENDRNESKSEKTIESPYAAVKKPEPEAKKLTKPAAAPIKRSPTKEVIPPVSPVKSPKSGKNKSGKNDSNEALAPAIVRKKSAEFSKANVVQSIVNVTVIDTANVTNFIDASNISAIPILKDDDSQSGLMNLMALATYNNKSNEEVASNIVQSKLLKSVANTGVKVDNESAKTGTIIQNLIQNINKQIQPLSSVIEYLPEDLEGMARENAAWDPLVDNAKKEFEIEKEKTLKLMNDCTAQQNEINLRIKQTKELIKIEYYNLHYPEDEEMKIINSMLLPR